MSVLGGEGRGGEGRGGRGWGWGRDIPPWGFTHINKSTEQLNHKWAAQLPSPPRTSPKEQSKITWWSLLLLAVTLRAGTLW
jgi:hypothetical protein